MNFKIRFLFERQRERASICVFPFLYGWQGPKPLGHHLQPSGVLICRKKWLVSNLVPRCGVQAAARCWATAHPGLQRALVLK